MDRPMEVRPSSGGAVIVLSPLGLAKMKRDLERAGGTWLSVGAMIAELRTALAALPTDPISIDQEKAMRLDPAFSGPEEEK